MFASRIGVSISFATALLLPVSTFAQSADSSSSASPLSSMVSSSVESSSSSSASSIATDSSASSTPQGKGTVVVQQVSKSGVLGSWTLIYPSNTKSESKKDSTTLTLPAGKYTIIAEAPEGATARADLFSNDVKILSKDFAQITFDVKDGDNLRIAITHTFTRTGKVGVQSTPPGLKFTLTGPNNTTLKGSTPAEFIDMPEGLYSVTYDAIEGCITPKPKSSRLAKDSRVILSIEISCENMDALPQTEEWKKQLIFVNGMVDGSSITFTDLPIEAWFARYCADMIKAGIFSGYRDSEGKPNGQFGPGNIVTVGELAKIAHRIAGTEPSGLQKRAKNPNVPTDAWFSPYMASAESKQWIIFSSYTIDPLRPATRGEVVVTLLQALNIPAAWPQGNMFKDVTLETPYAGAIETAATDELIMGYENADGEPTGEFGPGNPINRAEMAKMLSSAVQLYKNNAPLMESNERNED